MQDPLVRPLRAAAGGGARQQAVSGDNILANLSYATPLGTLSGFAYLVDQDEAAVQAYRLSSQTYGVRLAGSQPLSKSAKVAYQLTDTTEVYVRGENLLNQKYQTVLNYGTPGISAFAGIKSTF